MRKNAIVVCDSTDRIYVHSGITKNIITSFSTISTNTRGLAWDGKSFISSDTVTEKIYLHSGRTNNVTNSFSSASTDARDVAWDGKNLLHVDVTTERAYLYSAFSDTILNSYSTVGIDPEGIVWDGEATIVSDSDTNKIYRYLGFSKTVLNSFTVTNGSGGLAWDGKNLYHALSSLEDRIAIHSGFSREILNSFSSVAATPEDLTFETTYSSSDVIELNNQDLLVTYNTGNDGANFAAISKRYDVSTAAWQDEVIVDGSNTNYTHPAIVQLSLTSTVPNRVILAMYDHAASTINIYSSDTNGDSWVSVTTITSVVNAEHLSMANSSDDLILAYNRGRTCFSRKSTDTAVTWGAEVTLAANSYSPSVIGLSTGSYGAIYQGQRQRIYYASSVDNSSWNIVSSAVFGATGKSHIDPTIALDSNGDLHGISHNAFTDDLEAVKSKNNGFAWDNADKILQKADKLQKGLYSPSATRFQDEIYCIAEAWDGTNGHLVSVKTHDWKTITESLGYTENYEPILGLPNDLGWELDGTDGTGTIENGVLVLETTGDNDRYYTNKKSDIGFIRTSSGLKARFELLVESGGSTAAKDIAVRFVLRDSPSRAFDFEFRFSTTGFVICDNAAEADVSGSSVTHAMTTKHEFLVTLQDAVVTAWYRSSHENDNKWINIISNKTLIVSNYITGIDLIYCDLATDRIYKLSGFSDTVLDSFSAPGTSPSGLAYSNTNLLHCDLDTDRIYKLSGFSDTVLDSFSALGATPSGLAYDGINLLHCDRTTDRIYKLSGFSDTVLDSFSAPGTFPSGLTYDGINLVICDGIAERIYKVSGFSDTVLDSFSAPGASPSGLTYDGINLVISDGITERIYKVSGFSDTVLDSFSAFGTSPSGLTYKFAASQIQFGIFSDTAKVKFYSMRYAKNDDALSDGFTDPDDLTQRTTGTSSSKQFLKDGVEVIWGGSDGAIGDEWLINSGFHFARKALFEDSPSNIWRSTSDDQVINIVFDAGANKVFDVDMFSFINANFKTGRFQMNALNSGWGNPSIDIPFDSQLSTLTATSLTEEKITDASQSYTTNEYARPNQPRYVTITGGNLISGDSVAERIYIHSGFSKTIINSFSSPGNGVRGLAFDKTDLLVSDDQTDKIYKMSGISKTVKDSFSSPNADSRGLVWDGQNLIHIDRITPSPAGRFYKYSGFSNTLLDSFSSNAPSPSGLAYDDTYYIASDNTADKIYKYSGFQNSIIDSFSANGSVPNGLTWDGINVINSDSTADRIFKHSGFSKIIIDSFSSPSTFVTGLTFQNSNINSCKIDRNTTNTLVLDNKTIIADGATLNSEYAIFSDRIAKTLGATQSYRFIRLVINKQKTEDGYYKLGRFIFGLKKQTTKGYNIGFREGISNNTNINLSNSGQKFSNKEGEARRNIEIEFKNKNETFAKEIESMFDHIDWENNTFVFVKDGEVLTDFILGRLSKNYGKQHIVESIFTIKPIMVEEEL